MKKNNSKFSLLKTKKGVSMVIGWVLLVGFAVTVGLLIYNWSTNYAEQSVDSVVEFVSGKTECTDVSVNIIPCVDSLSQRISMVITNKGLFNIYGLSFNIFTDGNTIHKEKLGLDGEIKVKESRSFNLEGTSTQANINSIEVTPIINNEGGMIGCSDKKVILTKEILESKEWELCSQIQPIT